MDLFLEASYSLETRSTANGIYEEKSFAISVLIRGDLEDEYTGSIDLVGQCIPLSSVSL